MSTKNHTPIATGAPANSAIVNAPLGQIDSAIGDLAELQTTDKSNIVDALNEIDDVKQDNFTSQSANQVLASPTTTSGSPGFRALVSADLPLSGVTAGTYTKLTVNNKGIATTGANLTVSDISDINTINIDAIGSGTDITTNNVSTTKHGLMPKLPNDSTKYMDGAGNYVKWASGVSFNGSGAYTPRAKINFKGAGVVVQDNSAGDGIDVNISGIAGGNQSLETLTDTSLSSPLNNEVLTFDTATGLWLNKNISSFIPTGHIVSASGVNLTNRPTINFGTGITAIDNSGANRTDIQVDLPSYSSGSVAGLVEITTSSNVTLGTSASLVISPSALAHSDYGKRGVQIALNGDTELSTDDKGYFRISDFMNGWNLIAINASCSGSSTSGSPTFTIKNGSQTMLSTDLTINESAKDSSVSGAGTIDTSHDSVSTGDRIEVGCSEAGTGVTYAVIDLNFQLP